MRTAPVPTPNSLHGRERRFDEMWMGGQAQVVVRGQADHGLAVDHRVDGLRRAHLAQRPVEVLGAQLVEFVAQVAERVGTHLSCTDQPSCGSRTILPAWPEATRSKAFA